MTQKVSKSSIRLSLFKLRRLAVALVLLFAVQGVWGETYFWVGGDGNWSDNTHWNTQANGNGNTAPVGRPNEDDTVYITDGPEITITNTNGTPVNITIANLSIANGDNTAKLNLGNNTLTITEMHLGTEGGNTVPQ